MKKATLLLFAIALLLGLHFSCSTSIGNEASVENVLAENTSTVDMKVEGMVCAMGCAKYIQDNVAEMDGVIESQVDFENGEAHFVFDASKVDGSEIEEFINEIHDGQYKASIYALEDTEEIETETEDGGVEEDEEEISSIEHQKVNISFPKLLTYFLGHL